MKGGLMVKVLEIIIFAVIMYALAAPLSPLFWTSSFNINA